MGAVTYDLLVATPDGTLAAPAAEWAHCRSAKPPSETGPVSEACLGDGVAALGGPSASVQGMIPYDACQLFGPELPPQKDGQAQARARDPDVTGGYYQPVRVQVRDLGRDLEAFGFERVTCNLASAGTDVALGYKSRYVRNTAPVLSRLWAAVASTDPVDLPPVADGVVPDATLHVPRGAIVTLGAEWPPEAVETFVVYDLLSLSLVDQRESMRVSWFTTDGDFAHDRTGRGSGDLDTVTTNTLTAPASPGVVHLWVVLRDSRGGITWIEAALVVD